MADLRASDADRERTVEALREQCHLGRLTLDELDERVGAAYAARTLRELAELLEDLGSADLLSPAPPPGPVTGGARAPLGPPGRVSFTAMTDLREGGDGARMFVLEHIAPLVRSFGYERLGRASESMSFLRRRRPLWTILVAVFLFPIGLIALLVSDEDRIDVDLYPLPGGGTRVLVDGTAPRALRRAIRDLA